jgi:hypothetical protein
MKKIILAFLSSVLASAAFAQIPNFKMENWTTVSEQAPANWEVHGKITRIAPAPDGNYAIKLEADPQHQDIGAIVYGDTKSKDLKGGIPWHSRPDSLIGNFQFDIKTGDTAWVVVAFQKQGAYVSYDIFHITGTQNAGLKRLGFEINYLTSDIPDTVFIGVTSSNPQGNQYYPSYMMVDNLHFTNTTDTIPNHSFERWTTLSYDMPNGWSARNDFRFQSVQKTTDAFRGSYAMKIQNVPQYGQPGFCSTLKPGLPDSLAFQPMPAFPLTKKPDTLYMFFKFLPQGGDSASVMINVFSKGKPVGTGYRLIGGTYSKYTGLKVPIFYGGGGVPDSAYIALGSFAFHNGPSGFHGASMFYVDNLSFDSLFGAGIDEVIVQPHISVFPNPSKDIVNIIPDNNTRILSLEMIDITGKLVKSYNTAERTINIQNLSSGMYILRVTTNLGIAEKKVWKE